MKSFPLGYLVLAALPACLSIDAIPVAEPEEQEAGRMERDAGGRDAAGGPLDASSSDAELAPDASTPDASTSDASTDATVPEQTPVCGPGVAGPCLFELGSARGKPGRPSIAGAHIYWTESGTTDALNNYRYDGALVRTQIGAWQTHDVVTGIDFYDEASRAIMEQTVLASTQYVVWGASFEASASYAALSAPTQLHALTLPGWLAGCRLEAQELFCGDSPQLRRLDQEPAFGPVFMLQGNDYNAVFPTVDAWYLQGPYNAVRVDRGSAEPVVFPPAASLLDALSGNRVLGRLADLRIGVATVDGDAALRWRAVAGAGQYLGTHAEWIYWGDNLWAGYAQYAKVYRNRIDDGTQQLVADLATLLQREPGWAWNHDSFDESGIVFSRRQEGFPNVLLYVPLPAD